MASVTVKTTAGADAGSVDLDDALFGIEPNVPVMHQVVTAQLAAKRAGTQSTKTRAEVRAAAPSPGSRRAPVAPAPARPARRSGGAAAWPSAPSPVATTRRPPRR